MKSTKILRPSGSYHLEVPGDLSYEVDGQVCSLWRSGDPLLLQLSSYFREEGPPVADQARLADRISNSVATWTLWERRIHPDPNLDQATGEFTDEKGLLWLCTYLVWSHLTVLATISGSRDDVRNDGNWALEAMRSIELTTQ